MILKKEKIRKIYGIRRKVTSKKVSRMKKLPESRKWHPKAANACEWQNKLLQKF